MNLEKQHAHTYMLIGLHNRMHTSGEKQEKK